MLCIVLQGPTFEELAKQIEQAYSMADCIEIRLDKLERIDFLSLKNICELITIPFIFTLRSVTEGGGFKGSKEEQMSLISSLLPLHPNYLDLEFSLPATFVAKIIKDFPQIKVILSAHDFEGKIKDPAILYEKMKQIPASLYKIAIMAHRSCDALNILLFLKDHQKYLSAISMGPYGEISRIVGGPIFGSRITYAALNDMNLAAPGQLTAEVLLKRYHFKELNAQTALFGLIGDPVEQSISDVTHNEYFKKAHVNGIYVKMRVTPDELKDFLSLCRQLPFRGLSVTMPLKEVIIPLIDELDVKAQKIGAVNTLLFDRGKIKGFNTDCIGALDAIEEKIRVANKKVVIIGAGGAARAIAYEAILRGAHVILVNRHKERAEACASEFGCISRGLEDMTDIAKNGYDIVINATPSPMPVPEKTILPGVIAMDVKTKPQETLFLIEAKRKGCECVYGIDMFFRQAQQQFAIWDALFHNYPPSR